MSDTGELLREQEVLPFDPTGYATFAEPPPEAKPAETPIPAGPAVEARPEPEVRAEPALEVKPGAAAKPEPEVKTAEAAPPAAKAKTYIPHPDLPNPPAEGVVPEKKKNYIPYAPPPTAEERTAEAAATAAKTPTGIGRQAVAGTVEGAVPGLAQAAASPVDMPVNMVRGTAENLISMPGEIGALSRRIGSLFGWSTPETEQETADRKAGVQAMMPFLFPEQVPYSPGGTYLAKKADEAGLPSENNPFDVEPRTDAERMVRRGTRVGSQIATSTLGSKAFGKLPEPGASPTLTAGVLAGPRAMGSAPPIATGVAAGGGDIAGQYAGQQAREAGFAPESARQLEVGAGLASTLPIGLGMNVAKHPLSRLPYEVGASGRLGPTVRRAAERRLAAKDISAAGPNVLAREGDWNSQGADPRNALKGQEITHQQATAEGQQARQDVSDAALKRIGGEVENLTNRLETQKTAMSNETSAWNVLPNAVGKAIRTGMNNVIKKTGPLLYMLDKHVDGPLKGKPVIADSDVPGRVFNEAISTEDFNSMFHQANKNFRGAYESAALADFLNFAGKRNSAGELIGIDLTKAKTWQDKHKQTLDNYDEASDRLWGADARNYDIRTKVGTAIERQKGIDSLNDQLNGLGKSIGPGGVNKEVATAVWKSGPEGGDAVKGYLDMSRGMPDALNNVIDIAAASLRNFAVKDGKLVPGLFDRWVSMHKNALDQLPPEVRDGFTAARSAQDIVETFSSNRARALDELRNGAAKGMLGGTEPEVAISEILKNPNPDAAIRDLSNKLRSDPAAHDGLKRAFMEVAVKEAEAKANQAPASGQHPTGLAGKALDFFRARQNARETSDRFLENLNDFLSTNKASVRELFGEVAADSMQAMIRKGAPGHGSPGAVGTVLSGLLAGTIMINEVGGYFVYNLAQNVAAKAPVLGGSVAVGALAHTALNRVRAAGMRNAHEFFVDAMTRPDLMRDLSKSATDQNAWNRVIRQIGVIGTGEEMGGYGMGKRDRSSPDAPIRLIPRPSGGLFGPSPPLVPAQAPRA